MSKTGYTPQRTYFTNTQQGDPRVEATTHHKIESVEDDVVVTQCGRTLPYTDESLTDEPDHLDERCKCRMCFDYLDLA